MTGERCWTLGSVLLLALLVCWTGGGVSRVAAQEAGRPDRITVNVIEGTQLFPMHVLTTRGIAGKYNLDIDIQPAAGAQGLYTMMQFPEFQVGFGGWLTVALFRANGLKLINVMSMFNHTDDVLVPVDSPLQSFADLKGRRVGLYAGPSGATTWVLRYETVKFFGFDLLEESEIHYGAPPLLVGMLERGELDAVIMLDPEVVRMLESGKYRSIGNLGLVWREFSGSDALLVTVVMNEEWAEANRDVATRFVAAFKEAVEFLWENDDVWVELGEMLNIRTPEGVELLRKRTAAAFTLKWDEEVIQEQHAFIADVRTYFGEADGIPDDIPAGTFRLDFVR